MAERVVLHVGTMKTGTTFLQHQLFANKAGLARQGVHVPCEVWNHQHRAVLDLLEAPQTDAPIGGAWRRLVDEVDAVGGTAVVTDERLARSRPAKVAEAVTAFAGAEVSIVITARDISRGVGSLWQESVQNGRTWTWPEYAVDVAATRPGSRAEGRPGGPGARFWHNMNLPRVAAKWGGTAGSREVTVVTVPPAGGSPDRLLRRFGEACGFSAEGFVAADSRNTGLGVASLELLRRLNVELESRGLPFPAGQQLRKYVLAKRVLSPRRALEGAVGTPVVPWAEAETERAVRRLGQLGVRLVGEWTDLVPTAVDGVDPSSVPEADVLAAGVAGLAGVEAWLAGDRATPHQAHESASVPQSVAEAVDRLASLVERSARG